MTHPDFTFDEKTGELARGGMAAVLSEQHAAMFVILRGGDYVESGALRHKLGRGRGRFYEFVKTLRKRLIRFGLNIETSRQFGYRLVVRDIPKWTPDIPPPLTIEQPQEDRRKLTRKAGRPLPKMWTPDEFDRAITMRNDGFDHTEIAAALGRSQTSVQSKFENDRRARIGRPIEGAKSRVLSDRQQDERARRSDGYDARDLTSQIMGDPPRGFSALDQRGRR